MDVTSAARSAASQITAGYLREAVTQLASDAFEGRGPATPGDQKTRAYLADRLKDLGYQPGGPGGQWEQFFDIVGVTAAVQPRWRFTGKATSGRSSRSRRFHRRHGVQAPTASVAGRRSGLRRATASRRPSITGTTSRGSNLRGKILLMLNNDPDWDPEAVRRQPPPVLRTLDLQVRERRAARCGGRDHHPYARRRPVTRGRPCRRRGRVRTSSLPRKAESRVQIQAWVTEEATRASARIAGTRASIRWWRAARSRDFTPVPLGMSHLAHGFTNTLSRVQTANVLGVLPGSDPALRDQVVIYTAHHDHLGIGQPDGAATGIYNGALDNAAGCAQLLAVARAFAALPQPPRARFCSLRRRRRAGAARLGVLRHAPDVPCREDRRQHQLRRRQHLGARQRRALLGFGKSTLDAVGQPLQRLAGPRARADELSRARQFLPLRSVQLRRARCSGALRAAAGIDFLGRPDGWGREQNRCVGSRSTTISRATTSTRAGIFDGMVEDTQLGFYSGWMIAQANRDADLDAGRRIRSGAQGGDCHCGRHLTTAVTGLTVGRPRLHRPWQTSSTTTIPGFACRLRHDSAFASGWSGRRGHCASLAAADITRGR